MNPRTIRLIAIPEQCYRCGGITRGIVGVLKRTDRGDVLKEFDEVSEALAKYVGVEQLSVLHIGELKLRTSRTRGTYLSNGCVHCDALLGSFPLRERLVEHLASGGGLEPLTIAITVDP